ncbi:MAG: hypothetical protein U9Q22_03490 [Candidatus Altiarchaeota archaeon]|nr:hypothetical protein [Candidatus Altiarchaeota archaeon]
MNDLELIKQVEEEVAGKIKKARQDANASINEMNAREGQMIQDEVGKAKAEIKAKLKETKMKAEKNAKKIVTDGGKQVIELQNLVSERQDNAVELIMNELRG